MAIKSALVAALTVLPALFVLCSKSYHFVHRRFRTLSPGTPQAIARALDFVRRERGKDAGDYYEFGLFRGYTFLSAFEESRRLGLDSMRLYGFDSFQGLPTPKGEEAADARFFAGQFAATRERVTQELTKRGMDWSRAELVEGFYEDSLTPALKAGLPRRDAGVVLLDCDLYSSTRTALTWLKGIVHPGTVLLFDDWGSYDGREDAGQPLAFAEYLAANPHLRTEDFGPFSKHGKGFVLRQA